MSSPFSITPTEPTALEVEIGKEGTFSFTVKDLAAPGTTRQVVLQAQLLDEDGRAQEVSWLIAGPSPVITLKGGETESPTIKVKPVDNTPTGDHQIRLVVADRIEPNEKFTNSAPVSCKVIPSKGPPPPKPKKPLPKWLIPVIVGGVLLLGGGAFAAYKLATRPPGLGDDCDPAATPACRGQLICNADQHKCLSPAGAECSDNRTCDSGECNTTLGLCTSRLGQPCDPATPSTMPCPTDSSCNAASRTCLRNACVGNEKQCADARNLRTCEGGTWTTAPCPTNAALCRDGACVCSADQGKPCNCGGTVQCDGSCSAPACSGVCNAGQCCNARLGQACGSCGGTIKCDGSCSVTDPSNLGQACGSCGGTIQCNGQCSRPNPPNFGQACGSCGGTIKCDGTCSAPNPPNLGQRCSDCGGTIQCNGQCNIPNPGNFNQPCGECGGRWQCNGQCSNNTPRCPSGYAPDPSVPGQCRSNSETEVFNQLMSIGGAQWDGCDPCGCGLGFDRTISIPCGVGRSQSSFSIGKQSGGAGTCTGTWTSGNATDCSVNIRFSTSWCDNFKCQVTVRAVNRRPQCQ